MSVMGGRDRQHRLRDVRIDSQGFLLTAAKPLRYLTTNHLVSTGTGLNSLVVPPGAYAVQITVREADIYWNCEGGSTTPSSTIGDDAMIGDVITLVGPSQMEQCRAVRQGATNFRLKNRFYSELTDE